MGLFDKIKTILFEDEDEEDINKSLPDYTKEEEEVQVPVAPEVIETPKVVEEPIQMNESSRFKNVKRDIDMSFDEKDVLEDIINTPKVQIEPEPVLEMSVPKKVEEKKSVFQTFDEAEFDRLNSRVNKNEARVKQDIRNNIMPSLSEARKANNNFSATTTNIDKHDDNHEKYRLSSTPVKKTFTPSPIISPVYGILDKNYTKDDIVDKKDGLKREKIVKPALKKVDVRTIEEAEAEVATEKDIPQFELPKKEETHVVDIDSVRKKAFGELEDLEKTLTDLKLPQLEEVKVIDVEEPVVEEVVLPETDVVENNISIEDELDKKFSIDDIELDEEEKELDRVIGEKLDAVPEKKKPQLLDDLEKTSTLQILDDIEKELNSIKPITRDIENDDIYDEKTQKDESLEKDLFNLIDSMYEEGEEEEDNG